MVSVVPRLKQTEQNPTTVPATKEKKLPLLLFFFFFPPSQPAFHPICSVFSRSPPSPTATMIIYEDVISGDEMLADTFKIVPNKDCPILWEVDCRKYMKSANEDFELEGANPSAEGGDDEGGEGETKMVHDIEDQFRLVWLKTEEGLKPSKEAFKGHLKCMP